LKKVLIIKIGYSETLHPKFDETASLGDVLRTTVILHPFKDYHVTWLTGKEAVPVLKGNPFINQILVFDLSTALQLHVEKFDVVINLEKVPGLCALTTLIKADKKVGFNFGEWTGLAEPYLGNYAVLHPYLQIKTKRMHQDYWQKILYKILGLSWKDEEYVLGYKPKSKILFDVGLNYLVGKAWPLKAWPILNFNKLYYSLKKNYSVSYQQGEHNLYEYMNWINSCKLIVTNDSLGLHLAIAMKKKIVALFGPSSSHEIFLYGLGTKISSVKKFDCMPCWKQKCTHEKTCMEEISVEQVAEEVKKLL